MYIFLEETRSHSHGHNQGNITRQTLVIDAITAIATL